ncbi:MAG TPA: hypothetical protein DCF68_00770 [Cyanothece sp. UBA12306]|nr:hypothetical protein [Cyanothece sp. UBA12306]
MADIFISSSLKDIEWVKRIQDHLAPLLKKKNLSLWSYDLIYPGENWQESIERAIKESQVIIVLISSHYLNSQLPEVELSLILQKYQKDPIKVFPVIISPVSLSSVPTMLKTIQTIGSFSESLSELPEQKQEDALMKLAEMIDNSVLIKQTNVFDVRGAKIGNITGNIFVNATNELAKNNDQ